MTTEKGVILVVYKESRGHRRFLVLKRTKNWEGWELPKGHLEDGYESTVRLELEEEAGIEESEIVEVEEMGETVSWSFEDDGEEIHREYRAFLVRVDGDAIVDVSGNPHDEHDSGYFFNYDDVHSLLTYDDQRSLLREAKETLE
ncbi:MAG: NUDIX domain-containing protein [Candidatus Nanohaloarchaea archaeon]